MIENTSIIIHHWAVKTKAWEVEAKIMGHQVTGIH